jgi:hypothetical protein
MYTVKYMRMNAITKLWNRHEIRVDSDRKLTEMMLDMAWEVTTGEFLILEVRKAL